MAIDGLIILDNNGHPIIQTGFRSTTPSYALLHIDAFNNAVAKAARESDVDPVLHVPPYNVADGPSACCHVPCGDVRILCPISRGADPLVGFAFLQTFIEILHEYFGFVSAATLRDNFDIVYQLLEEMLDSGGHPLTTFPNALRDIVVPPTPLSKLLSAANLTASFNSYANAASVFSSPIPWRKGNVKHSTNEIYLDIAEEMVAIVNKQGVTISSTVWGRIECDSRLSGMPDLLLTFKNPYVLTDCSFHSCVRLARWSSNQTLSFLPPDGKFILMDYRYSPASLTVKDSANPTSLTVAKDLNAVPVPFLIRGGFEFEENTAGIDLKLTPRLSGQATSLEDLALELYLGDDPGISAVRCDVGRGLGGFGSAEDGTDGGAGSWSFDPKRRVLRWDIGSAGSGTSCTLKGSWSAGTNARPRPARALQVTFRIPRTTFSALKIDQLKVTGEAYKPYKGMRGHSTGRVEWRI